MDLYAYAQIGDLQAIADRNGISVPRCRGYRLMKSEQFVTAAEIEQMINDQAMYEVHEYLRRGFPRGFYRIIRKYSEASIRRCRRCMVYRKTERGHEMPVAVRWDKVHGKHRKEIKWIFRRTRKQVHEQYDLFNSYVGRDDVLYIHARLGSTSWTDEKNKAEVICQPWFLSKVDDSFDSSYCDIYARIGREEEP